jgi:hypothetical protein
MSSSSLLVSLLSSEDRTPENRWVHGEEEIAEVLLLLIVLPKILKQDENISLSTYLLRVIEFYGFVVK